MGQNDDQEDIASNKQVNNDNSGPIDSDSDHDDLNLNILVLNQTVTATKNMVYIEIETGIFGKFDWKFSQS